MLAEPSEPCPGFLFPSGLAIPSSVPFLRATCSGRSAVVVVAGLVCPAGPCSGLGSAVAGPCFDPDSAAVAGCCRRSAADFAAVAA